MESQVKCEKYMKWPLSVTVTYWVAYPFLRLMDASGLTGLSCHLLEKADGSIVQDASESSGLMQVFSLSGKLECFISYSLWSGLRNVCKNLLVLNIVLYT